MRAGRYARYLCCKKEQQIICTCSTDDDTLTAEDGSLLFFGDGDCDCIKVDVLDNPCLYLLDELDNPLLTEDGDIIHFDVPELPCLIDNNICTIVLSQDPCFGIGVS